MQKHRVNKSINGEGIYEECDNSANNVQQTQCNTDHFDANNNSLSRNESSYSDLSFSENRFDVILDALDQQVETLNELRRSGVKRTKSPTEDALAVCISHLETPSENPHPSPREHLHPEISYRKSLLETYVRTNISEDGNCSCRYHFGSNELKLLNELNECYRKFCQFSSDQLNVSNSAPKHPEAAERQRPTQQVIEEASNFIGCEREISRRGAKCGGNHSCLPNERHTNDDTEHLTRAELQQRRPSSEPRALNEPRLFIDAESQPLSGEKHPHKSGSSGHHRAKGSQLARAKSDSETHSAARRRAERGEPSLYRVGGSESALYDNSFATIVGSTFFDPSSPASILDSDIADESRSASDESQSSQNQSGPEYEQRSALIGIEESPICVPSWTQRSTSECKRKHRSPRSTSRRHKQRSSTSSLDESLLSDYPLGCSLTYESVASASPRHFSPFEQSPAHHWANSDDFDSTTASNRTRTSDHDHYSTLKRRARHQVPRQVDGPSEATVDSLFIPAENYHSIESCASYEIEESGTSLQPRIALPDEQPFSASSTPDRRRSRRRPRKRHTRRPSSNASLQFETLSSPQRLSYSSTSSFSETMESDGAQNHDNGNDSAHNLREVRGLKHHGASDCPLSTKSNGSPAPKVKPDTVGSGAIREHHSTRLPPLGTNAKTRLQQKGVEIQYEHLRSRGSSQSSGANAPTGANMKAAKDIAKVSIPALASLQFLPGQVDVRGSRSIDRLSASKQASRHKAIQVERSSSMTQQIKVPTRGDMISGNTPPPPPQPCSRDAESGKHDDSCLLHRLCLCNCLARSHSNTVKKLRNRSLSDHGQEREKTSPSRSSESSPPRRWRARVRDHDEARLANGPASANSNSSNETNLSGKEDTRLAMRYVRQDSGLSSPATRLTRHEESRAGERERQSPSFTNLLKPSLRQAQLASKLEDACKSKKYVDSRAVAQRDKQLHRGASRAPAKPARINSTALGSIGDLAASGRSSASDSHMSECSPPTRCVESNSSKTGLSSDGARHDSRHLEVAANTQTEAKSPRSCKDSAHNGHRAARVPSYKKLLSPRRLFSSSSSSVCDCCEQQNREPRQPSFLSRSLNRLSGRKRQSSSSSSQRDQPIEAALPRSPSCTSPTGSISNSQPDTYSDSINSLDEINLAHSLPFSVNEELLGSNFYSKNSARLEQVPDIILSRVEYQEVACTSSRSMTRSPSSQQHQRPSSAQSLRNNDHAFVSHQPHRHLSELSFNASDMSGSLHESRGPFSLPGSPSSRRRRRNRSPRLSQSPVPFQSPANESTKIADGLKVCSTEHFEKHIGNIKDNQVEAQKRLFTAWINHFAPNLIRHDLIVELQDGIKLIGLLATLTHDKQLLNQYERLNRDKQSYINRLILTPSSRLKQLSNVSIAIDYLRRNQGMKLVNLHPMDIVSGKANVILGLCWSIILNFQFDKNFLKGSDSSSDHSSSARQSTSRLSSTHTNEDRARAHKKPVEEFTTKDIANARNRILDHINKRYNLKLTNLTSSLIDGDVLLAIIRQLLPSGAQIDFEGQVYKSKSWLDLSDDEKLDYSFELAKDYLNVPKLISAADLRQQTIGENNPRPLLIYLSMLLKADSRNCSTDQILELRQLDECLKKVPEDQKLTQDTLPKSRSHDINSTLSQRLDDLDTKEKFYIEKLQSTLAEIREIDSIIRSEAGNESSKQIDQHLIGRHLNFKKQAEQVELLIDWINRAGQLFETAPRSSTGLAQTIDEYQRFFSSEHLPKVDTTLCPTLERQYRECLATAKQRVMSMEQTMKNWLNYDQASQQLKKWLVTAEMKLSEALRTYNSHDGLTRPQQSANPVDLHLSRLDDLVEYFELEPVDIDDLDSHINSFSLTPDGSSSNSLNLDQSNRSLSGSLISLGSTGSRLSTLTSSKKATYHRLFDDFELNCRLLAAMLESEQRDELLIILKELKSKLKYITEYKVPQVISEIRMSINRCEMSIQEQDECCSGTEDQANESASFPAHAEPATPDETSPSTNLVSDDADPSSDKAREIVTLQKDPDGLDLKMSTARQKKSKRRDNQRPQNKKTKHGSRTQVAQTAVALNKSKKSPDNDKDLPYLRRFWNKLARASKLSLSFNIVLLLCLAGICVVPLIQRDACCELSQSFIPGGEVTVNQKPT